MSDYILTPEQARLIQAEIDRRSRTLMITDRAGRQWVISGYESCTVDGKSLST